MIEGVEYGIPVMFDVTGPDRQQAGQALSAVLAAHQIPGTSSAEHSGVVESWWTIEWIDKAGNNDNQHGVVVFQDDLTYLHLLLELREPLSLSDRERHERLHAYFDPRARIGSVPFLIEAAEPDPA